METIHQLLSDLENTPSVLLVEDEPRDAELSVSTLRVFGADTHWARGQGEAEELLKNPERKFDIALLDLHLMQGSGLEVLKVIKASRPNLPVVIVSGYVRGDDFHECTKLGYFGVVEKPLTPLNLNEMFRAHRLK